MDAVEFIKERNRLCKSVEYCSKCPINNKLNTCHMSVANPEEFVEIVQQWSQAHPQKTMMQDFFEKFPNSPKNPNGTPQFCPRYVGYSQQKDCTDCVNKYLECWSRPLEE